MIADSTPNFFLLGAAKCGTTSLHHYLCQHPQVFMTQVKEPHFFDDDEKFEKGMSWYQKEFFAGSSESLIRGEGTPSYFHLPETIIPRIKQSLPPERLKFVLVFRDPVKRCWSQYLHLKRTFMEELDFDQALLAENKRRSDPNGVWYAYFENGLYAKQLKPWLEAFPKKNFLFLLTHDLATEPEATIKRIFEFLEVDPKVEVDTKSQKNVGNVMIKSRYLFEFLSNPPPLVKATIKPLVSPFLSYSKRRAMIEKIMEKNKKPAEITESMPPGSAVRLRDAYRADILMLEKMIERDLSKWVEGENP